MGRLGILSSAEVMVTRDIFNEMLEQIGGLRVVTNLQAMEERGIIIMWRPYRARCVAWRTCLVRESHLVHLWVVLSG